MDRAAKEYVVLVTTRRLFYELSADVDITAGAKTERVRRSVTGDVSDTAYRWPHGNKSFGPRLTPSTARAVETFENRYAISPRTKTNSRSEPAEPATNDDGMTHDLRSI